LGRLERGVEDFNVALTAEIVKPVFEEDVDLLLEENLLNARGDFVEWRHGLVYRVLRKENVVIVALNLLAGDLDALTEALLYEMEDFHAVADVSFDARLGEMVVRQECFPSGAGGAVGANTDRENFAEFFDAGVYFRLGRLDMFEVLLTNLLLDKGAADELLQGALGSGRALAFAGWVEDGKLNVVIDVAGKDDLTIDDGYNAIQDSRRGRLPMRRTGCSDCGGDIQDGCKQCGFAQGCLSESNADWQPNVHQNACPKLKKKLK
jgi:hypothetical protein